ncbi:acylphosphatase, partial [Myxococcota bacterium]|nr:acylphosphatase [Myxococcota bacterium]MBU1536379.1 acylphosphatase [Myxococcota bacterium]
MARQRNRINITGIVQGVGFRPTVYSYAINNELAGTVCNDVTGVTIEVEGSREQVSAFIEQLRSAPPPLAHIESFVVTPLAPLGETRFIIVKSDDTGKSKEAAISPDMATCPDCLADIADPHNRRFRYPFTNCTNCG